MQSRKGGAHRWLYHYFLLLMRQPTSMKAFAKQLDQSSSSAKEVWVQTAGRLCLQNCCSVTWSCSHPSHQSLQKAGGKDAGTNSQFTSCFKKCSKIWVVLVFTVFPLFCEMLEKLWHWSTEQHLKNRFTYQVLKPPQEAQRGTLQEGVRFGL